MVGSKCPCVSCSQACVELAKMYLLRGHCKCSSHSNPAIRPATHLLHAKDKRYRSYASFATAECKGDDCPCVLVVAFGSLALPVAGVDQGLPLANHASCDSPACVL